jgi:hypothetical protein
MIISSLHIFFRVSQGYFVFFYAWLRLAMQRLYFVSTLLCLVKCEFGGFAWATANWGGNLCFEIVVGYAILSSADSKAVVISCVSYQGLLAHTTLPNFREHSHCSWLIVLFDSVELVHYPMQRTGVYSLTNGAIALTCSILTNEWWLICLILVSCWV